MPLARSLRASGRVMRRVPAPLVAVALVWTLPGDLRAQATATSTVRGRQAPTATFRAGVEVVTLTVAVRDQRGRVVRDLKQSDFQVFDSGIASDIRESYAGVAPISLAILLDISGSMAVGGNIDRARHAVAVAMGMLDARDDEAALFTFDARLQEVVSFTKDLDAVGRVSLEGRPWGMTSLYDAIAAAAGHVAERGNRHRALLVITDGVDTGSSMSAPEVSGIASSIDVPVYLLTVVTPLDHPGGEFAVLPSDGAKANTATLADLARWTGGAMKVASVPAHTVEALRDLFAELRYQYLITFEPGARPGWHPLEVRTRDRDLIVHARGWYLSGPARSAE